MSIQIMTKEFDICTDASDYQLGAATLRGGRPMAYFSKRLTPAQKNYTTKEKDISDCTLFERIPVPEDIAWWTSERLYRPQ